MKNKSKRNTEKIKQLLVFSVLMMLFIPKSNAQNAQLDWVQPFVANPESQGSGIATDLDGNVIVTGSFTGASYNPGGGALPADYLTNPNVTKYDVFISKYQSDGTHIKSVSFGGAGIDGDNGTSITTDEQNNIYITGRIDGGTGTDLDPGLSTTLSSPAIGFGRGDIFVSKYDENLNLLWAFSIPGDNFDISNGIAVDGNGYVYITGMFGIFTTTSGNPTDFDPSSGTTALTPNGHNPYGDIFVAKYNGNDMPSDPTFFMWAFNVGGNIGPTALLAQRGSSVCVDSNGMVYVTGAFHSPVATPVNFDPGGPNPAANLLSSGSRDIFVAKYDGNLATPQTPGFFQWAFNIGGSVEDIGWNIKTDSQENVIVTGEFSGTNVNFNPLGSAVPLTSNGSDLFLAKYDATTGANMWAFKVGGTDAGATFYDIGQSISLDDCDNIYLTGSFSGTLVDFNPLGSAVNLNSMGYTDIFVAKYNSSGNNQWAFGVTNPLNAAGYSIQADDDGHVYTTGFYRGTTDFDPGPVAVTPPSGGFSNTFVAAYSQDDTPTLAATSTTICEGQSTTLSILAGNLFGASDWQWYEGSCNGAIVGSGTSLIVSPDATTTYYANASGGCVVTGDCNSITITVLPQPTADAGVDQVIQIPQCASLSGIGSGGTAPYSYSWNPGGPGQNISVCPSPAGNYDYELTVTDINGCTNTDIVTVEAVDCIYELVPQQIPCSAGTFCLPVNTNQPVPAGIIGMDICINYDPSIMTPAGSGAGVATIGNVVTNGGAANSYIFFDNVTGELNISIYYDGSAPATAEFDQIIGNIVCIPFVLVGGTGPITTSYSVCGIDEGMLVGVNAGCIPAPATITVVNDMNLAGLVQYENSLYVLAGGTGEVPTNLNAADNSCLPFGPASVTGLSGEFNLNVTGAPNFKISRDIQGDYFNLVSPVMNSLINGVDALRVNQIATKDVVFIPTVYDIIAADVNMDGLVRANDATLILQRAVISIPEFPQAWNYVAGLPPAPDDLSLDWLFFDDTRLATDPDFMIDASYPNSSGTGYSRDLIPNMFTNCIQTTFLTTGSCVSTPDVNIQAVLLGDVESSWLPADAGYAKSEDPNKIVYYNLKNATEQNGNLIVPVYVASDTDVDAIDFTLDYNENAITVVSVTKSGNSESADFTYSWNDYQSALLMMSSYTTSSLPAGTSNTLFQIEINTSDIANIDADFGTAIISYLNGIEVNSVVIGKNSEMDETGETDPIIITPNPNKGTFNIVIPGNNTQIFIRVIDMQGKEIYASATNTSTNLVTLENVVSGIYIVQIDNGSGVQSQRLIIQ